MRRVACPDLYQRRARRAVTIDSFARSSSEAARRCNLMTIVRSATGLAALAATLSSIANGAQLVATRFIVQQNDPLVVALMRYAIAFACLLPLLRNSSNWPARRDCVIILMLGAMVAGICPWLLTLSMQYTTASRGALVICTSPLLTLMAAALLGYEKCTVRRLAGALCALLGVLVGLSDRLLAGTAQSFINLGDAIVLFTTILLALFNVYAGTMLLRYRATTVVPIATIGGLVVLFGLAAAHGSLGAILLLTGPDWFALLFCGTAGGAGVLLLWSWAIEHASAGRVAIFVTAAPMSAAITGAVVLSEPVTVQLVAGTALIIVGIWLVYQTAPEAATLESRAVHFDPAPRGSVRAQCIARLTGLRGSWTIVSHRTRHPPQSQCGESHSASSSCRGAADP